WVEPGIPMAKNADGKWEVAVKSTMDGVLKYKFWYKGTYIYDFKSPDKVDDGFGAFNGLVEVSKVLAKQKAKELEASGDAAGAAALLASVGGNDPVIRFLSATNFDIEAKFLTQGAKDKTKKGMDLNQVNFYTKAYSKFNGEIVPGVPVYAELALADGTTQFYNRKTNGTVDVNFKDAFKTFMNNTIAGPIGPWSNAGDKPMLGNFNFGVDTAYVNVLTGWKWAKLKTHNPIIWETIDGDTCAGHSAADGGGFILLTNGSEAKKIGDVSLDLGLSTNKSADGGTGNKFGIYTYATVGVAGVTFDAQYSVAFDGAGFFDKASAHDVIFGAKGSVGPVSLAGQALFDFDKADDKFAVTAKDMAFAGKFDYASDIFEGGLKYQFRGANAEMMYDQSNEDQLGTKGKSKVSGYATLKAIYGIELKLDGSVAYANEDAKGVSVDLKPNAIFSLLDLVGFDASVDIYTNLNLTTGDESKFSYNNLGMKVGVGALNDVVTGIDVFYGMVNTDDLLNNSIIARVKFPNELNADVGFLVRGLKADSKLVKEELNPFGFAVGVSKRFKAHKAPYAWAQFVWNMDPFNSAGDGRETLDLDGYLLDGYGDYDGAASFRVGIRWDI
ncbi:MAG: hypothetical protein IJ361_10790, partial [Spirochaetaceae bacterium]|nr:hypothetical protein [Spirochaetaceae bacterium]MBQ8668506.1 hypothetical protein [bacterium]